MPFGPTPVAPGGRGGGWAARVSPGTTIYLSQGRGQSGHGKPALARDEDRVGRGSQRLQRHTSTHSCLIRQKTQKSPGSRSGGVLRSTTQPE